MRRILFFAALMVFVSSCTHVISRSVRENARTDVPFREIKENIEKYKGTTFILGGVIVSTTNTEEGSLIEAMQTPVDAFGNIIDTDKSSGRFIATYNGHLDPLIYKKRREITMAGELVGSMKKKLGEVDYKYPLFEIKDIYLWRETREYYFYPSPPYTYPYSYGYPYWWYDPWWYGPHYPYYP